MKKEYKISDSVWARVIQIVQEAIMTGTDAADIMRMVRVEVADNDEELVLTEDYKRMVKEHYDEMIKRAEELKAASSQEPIKKLILS